MLARVRADDDLVRAATGDVNRARLRELGFRLGARAEAGVSDDGAWFATAPDGAPVVLKWFPDESVPERYAVLLPALDELRSRGAPVPEYPHLLAVDGWTLSAQQVLPGASVRNPPPAMVERVVECVAAMTGIACPLPAPDLRPWGASVVHALTVGVDGWAMHEPLRTGSRRSAAVLDRVEAVGADADPAWFPCTPTTSSPATMGGRVRGRSPLRSRQVRVRPRRARPTGLGRRRGHRHRAARASSVRRPSRAAVHVLAALPPHR